MDEPTIYETARALELAAKCTEPPGVYADWVCTVNASAEARGCGRPAARIERRGGGCNAICAAHLALVGVKEEDDIGGYIKRLKDVTDEMLRRRSLLPLHEVEDNALAAECRRLNEVIDKLTKENARLVDENLQLAARPPIQRRFRLEPVGHEFECSRSGTPFVHLFRGHGCELGEMQLFELIPAESIDQAVERWLSRPR